MCHGFNIGDVVKLKSGSDKMTIEKIDQDDYISCVWFDGATVQRCIFIAATLERVTTTRASQSLTRLY